MIRAPSAREAALPMGRVAPLPTASALRRAALDIASGGLRRLGQSRMGSVAYDSGFVARLAPLMPHEPFVRDAVRYLESTQSDEGYWGSPVPSLHDRVLSTLSATAGLALGAPASSASRIDRAVGWLNDAVAHLSDEPQLVGSDLLIPPLLEKCADLGLAVDAKGSPYRRVGRFAQALYGRVLYSSDHPVGHLIELTGERANAERIIANLLSTPSGSIRCAPSSTAFAIESSGRADPVLVEYLRRSRNPDGGQRHFGPYEIMEAAYSLYAMRGTPLMDLPAAQSALRLLRAAWLPGGVAFSTEFPAVDLDDSVLAALSITAGGERVSPDFLDHFVAPDYFLCYLEDRRGAVAPNLHAIEALRVLGHPRRDELTEVALKFVRSKVRPDGSFIDHYSVSPYYPTWHAIEALEPVDGAMASRASLFIAATQRADGSWGPIPSAPATAEDTAYAILGLCAHARANSGEYADEIARGASFLHANRDQEPLPTWIAKVLYTPTTMARCAVAGALAAAADAAAGGLSLSPTRLTGEVRLPAGARTPAAPPQAVEAAARTLRGS